MAAARSGHANGLSSSLNVILDIIARRDLLSFVKSVAFSCLLNGSYWTAAARSGHANGLSSSMSVILHKIARHALLTFEKGVAFFAL